MPPSVPTVPQDAANLADVLPSCLRAMGAVKDEWLAARGLRARIPLPGVRSAVVVLIDGLGANALASMRGHARFLAGSGRRLRSVFPTTTAAALATFTTGRYPGEHGVVGYSGWAGAEHGVVNLLSGWDRVVPDGWLRTPTVFDLVTSDTELEIPVDAVAVGASRYRTSGFTRNVLRGARYVDADSLEARVDAAAGVASEPGHQLVYLYIPELDQIAHNLGWQSGRWVTMLEAVDAAMMRLARALPTDVGMLVTADHGILDVPAPSNVTLDQDLLVDALGVAGDPRSRQITLSAGVDAEAVATAFRASLGKRAWVATRRTAIDAGWFGVVDPALEDRIGDVLIVGRGSWAFNDDRDVASDVQPRGMIGQHGGLSDDEIFVPMRLASGFDAQR